MEYSMRHIGQITGGKWLQLASDDSIGQLLLDSRRLIFPATTLFFALKGPRRDGVGFVGELYKRGVRNFVVGPDAGAAPLADMPEANILVVPNALAALQHLVATHRSKFSLPVIGITGSNGKTIVKEWLNQLLAAGYHIVRSPKSYNSQTGVPLSVWQMEPGHELAIFEAGISKRGEMARLEPIIRPTIGVFTNIGEAHSEGFVSSAEKAAEKLKLFDHAETLIFCGDQPQIVEAIAHRRHQSTKLLSWGHSQRDSVCIRSTETHDGWTTISISHEQLDLTFSVPFTDHASIENAMHCLCVLLLLKQPAEKIAARMAELSSIAMRLELKTASTTVPSSMTAIAPI